MNLIKEINAFYKLDMPGQMSFTAQSLYMALLHMANEIYSCDLTPSNGLLMAKTGIKDVKTLEKARQELINLGLITYIDNAKSRLAGKYHIIGLEGQLVDNFRKKSGENPEEIPGSSGKFSPHIQEENREEENSNPPIIPPEENEEPEPKRKQPKPKSDNRFNEFWLAYPRKDAKKDAQKVWDKLNPDEILFKDIMGGLERAKKSRDWIKDAGQYIPYAATWLNGERWKDENTPQKGEGINVVNGKEYGSYGR